MIYSLLLPLIRQCYTSCQFMQIGARCFPLTRSLYHNLSILFLWCALPRPLSSGRREWKKSISKMRYYMRWGWGGGHPLSFSLSLSLSLSQKSDIKNDLQMLITAWVYWTPCYLEVWREREWDGDEVYLSFLPYFQIHLILS